jgi:7-cyano-7-deazaguanine tRNA-ribosyltransferase
MREVFEIDRFDGAARLGSLTVPRADVTVETPALMPVVNPHMETVDPSELSAFGAQILITNSYILHGSDDLREPVTEQGLHELLGFDGAIMTDSGSFQLSEYGEIDVDNEEILRFQHEIGSDIGTPIDVPTPPDVGRERAESELATTQRRLEAAEAVDTGEMLVNAPIQGSTHLDLRESAARHAYGTDLDLFPVGAVVPLMNEYRYDDVVEVVTAAKRGLGTDAPVHLFGAGHPMMFALAAAVGCDLFDSAAYALYARDDRYLTVRGTKHLEDLRTFPCSCPVCTEYTPEDVRGMTDTDRERKLARHNLHVSFAEMRRVRQAIAEGTLLQLVDARARGHPTMTDGYRTLLDQADHLEAHDRVSKDTVFHVSAESARWPTVARYQDRLTRFSPEGTLLLAENDAALDGEYDERWPLVPPYGPVPPELRETFPLTAERPNRLSTAAYERAADGVGRLAAACPATVAVAVTDWPASARERLPESVETV